MKHSKLLLVLVAMMCMATSAWADEAFVVWCAGNTTLYFDKGAVPSIGDTYQGQTVTSVWSGETVTASTSDNPAWYADAHESCSNVVVTSAFSSVRPTSCKAWFKGFPYYLNVLDLSNLNTSDVTDMTNMFCEFYSLRTVYVDESRWSTENVSSSSNMFKYTSVVGGNGTSASYPNYDKTYAKVDKPSQPGYLTDKNFAYGITLTHNTGGDFSSDLSTAACGTTVTLTFTPEAGYKVKEVTIKDVINESVASSGTGNTRTFTMPAGKATVNAEFIIENGPFVAWCEGNTTLYFDKGAVPDIGSTYEGQTVTTVFAGTDVTASTTTQYEVPVWGNYSTSIPGNCTTVVIQPAFATVKPTSCQAWFSGEKIATIEGLEYLNTEEVTTMYQMFNNCQKLTGPLNLSSFNTAKVTNMAEMFCFCEILTAVDVTSFNTSKVTDMSNMFSNCYKLESIDVSRFDTQEVTNMRGMFKSCSLLESVNLRSFNTANVVYMGDMFAYSYNLKFLDLSTFDTSKVEGWNMSGMFSLYTSDGSITPQLKTIYVDGSKWNTEKISDSSWNTIFVNCVNLVGEKGTTYSDSHQGKDYAHIDEGVSNPGYLSGPLYLLTEADGVASLIDDHKGETVGVTFIRSFKKDVSSTICLPFSVSGSDASDAGKFYEFVGVDTSGADWIVTMQETNVTEDNPLVAGKPYLFKPAKTGMVTFIGSMDVAASATVDNLIPTAQTPIGDWQFVGTYKRVNWTTDPGTVYGFAAIAGKSTSDEDIAAGEFFRVSGGANSYALPFRAYLNYTPAAARGYEIDNTPMPDRMIVHLISADGTTSVGTLNTHTGEVVPTEGWYTLDGRRFSGKPEAKGLYINNGKKVVIK